MATDFQTLQEKLRPLWSTISGLNDLEQTIVVVPSLSLEKEFLERLGPQVIFYEERLLFLLLLLRQPRARLVYVSSLPIDERAIDYYVSLLPGVIPSNARKRLFLLSAGIASLEPLSQKILNDPSLLKQIRDLVTDPDRAHIVPYITTEVERDLALALDLPMYGCDPRLHRHGTKSGARRTFDEEGVPHPAGYDDLRSLDDLVEALAGMRETRGEVKAVIKHNEGVSGLGNAVLDLAGLAPGGPALRGEVLQRLQSIKPQGSTPAEYLKEFERLGGVVEEMINGELLSPSVQMRVTPLGELEVLSTHDQLLGGKSGQIYLGCVFPADPSYAGDITQSASKVGTRLAKEGVLGRFALDFVTVRNASGWDHYAVEINLRKGGTTHPYLTLQFLTGGRYLPGRGAFVTPSDEERSLVASDHAIFRKAPTLDDLFDSLVTAGLHFDNSTQKGVVLHMLGAVERFGVVGVTAVDETRKDADELFRKTLEELGAHL